MRSFIDTNVLVYRVDHDSPRQRAIADGVLTTSAEDALVISTQVLQEFYVVVTRKLARPLSPAEALRYVGYLCALEVVPSDSSFVRDAIERSQRHQLSLWDALIVQAAVTAKCQRILSEDLQDGVEYDGVRIENPFATDT